MPVLSEKLRVGLTEVAGNAKAVIECALMSEKKPVEKPKDFLLNAKSNLEFINGVSLNLGKFSDQLGLEDKGFLEVDFSSLGSKLARSILPEPYIMLRNEKLEFVTPNLSTGENVQIIGKPEDLDKLWNEAKVAVTDFGKLSRHEIGEKLIKAIDHSVKIK